MSRSTVWQYFKKSGRGNIASCSLCKKIFKCGNGSTSSLWKHLKTSHTISTTGLESVNRENVELNLTDEEQRCGLPCDVDSPSHERNVTRSAQAKMTSFVTVDHNNSNIQPTCSSNTSSTENNSAVDELMPQVQPKITSTFYRKSYIEKKSEKITQLIANMVGEDMLPLNFSENSGFRKLLSFLMPMYSVPSRNTIKSRINLQYNSLKSKLRVLLNEPNYEYVALTVDTWTSRTSTSYITVTAHVIKEWKSYRYTLTTEEMSERHTAENIKLKLIAISQEWNIAGKVCAVVHDNALNITNAIHQNRDLFGDSVPCFAHTLQLCINKGLSSDIISNLLKLSSDTVSHFHHSNIATSALQKSQRQLNLPDHKLIQRVKTRWNSTYYMLGRLQEQRRAVSAVLQDRNITSNKTASDLEMNEADWINVEHLIDVLKPFEMATKLLSGEDYPTISIAKPLMISLLNNFLKHSENDDYYEVIYQFKTTVSEEIIRRFGINNSSTLSFFDTSALLDPRYKSFITEDMYKLGKIYLDLLVSKLDFSEYEHEQKERNSTTVEFLFPDTDIQEKNGNIFGKEIDRYFQEPAVNKTNCLLTWWKTNSIKYPRLSRVALRYLTIPATSTPAERVFSTAGNIVSAKRNCLTPENVNMLIFLYENKKLYDSM